MFYSPISKMASHGFELDSVKAEKADAMRRYKRQRILTLCLHLAVTSALLWWFFTFVPVVQVASSVYLSVLNKPLFIFSLINALVFLIYNFSTNGNGVVCNQNDLYDQYVSLSSSSSPSSASCWKTQSDEQKQHPFTPQLEIIQREDIVFCDKLIVHCDNAANHDNPVRDLTVTETHAVDDTEEKRFKRTRSEKYATEKKKKSSTQQRKLQRSETEINGREMVVVADGGDRSQRKSIKDMNSEEFRLVIDRFIASRKKSLRDENFAVLMEEKEESFTAITDM